MELGTLRTIRRYRVKSLRGESLSEAEVLPGGIPGDRAGALLVRAGHARIGKPYRGKEHERLHLVETPEAAMVLARERGVDVELDGHPDGHQFDDAPVSLLVDRWLEGVSAGVGYRVDPERFRANFFVTAAPGFYGLEADLVGRVLRLGTVVLRVRKPIGRCVVTTYDPGGVVAPDPCVLRFIAQRRENHMGVYCDVLSAGRTSIGDVVTSV